MARGVKTGQGDLRQKQIAKAQWMINEGKGVSETARALGLSAATIQSWKRKGHLGPPGTEPKANLKLVPPAPLAEDPVIKRQLEKLVDPAVFARASAEGYKGLWYKVKTYLDEYLNSGGGEKGIQPRDVKDWVDVLQKLGTHVETYEAANKPSHTQDEAEMAQELRERNRAMRALYDKEVSA